MAETYQVFINHRGPDTKKNLASAIYHRLTRCHGLRVFLDMVELQPGNTVYPAIRRAIDSSSVHIALFSKGYADSRPCLNELCWMLGSSRERKIIPVFCDVEPRDLKDIEPRDLKDTNRKRPYAKAFEKYQLEVHRGDIKTEVMQGWKKALSEAADISGVVFKTDESDQGEFLEEIVKLVLKSIKWELLDVATYSQDSQEDLEGDYHSENMAGAGPSSAQQDLAQMAQNLETQQQLLTDILKEKEAETRKFLEAEERNQIQLAHIRYLTRELHGLTSRHDLSAAERVAAEAQRITAEKAQAIQLQTKLSKVEMAIAASEAEKLRLRHTIKEKDHYIAILEAEAAEHRHHQQKTVSEYHQQQLSPS